MLVIAFDGYNRRGYCNHTNTHTPHPKGTQQNQPPLPRRDINRRGFSFVFINIDKLANICYINTSSFALFQPRFTELQTNSLKTL